MTNALGGAARGADAQEGDAPLVRREDREGIAILTLNRPAQLNALSREMLESLETRLAAIRGDAGVRVVVLTGAGRAFSAGHDLREMRALGQDEVHGLFTLCCGLMRTILEIPQPVIASVRGIATAAGCQLVATCDLALAEEGARFATSGINVGLFCSTPGVALARNVARKRAFELLFTGDFIDARTACEWGLINRVVPAAELESATLDLARRIAAKSAATVASGKRMFYRQLEASLGDAYEYAARVMACDMANEDAAEGIDAFLEKRRPTWRDR